jgi:molybdopterin synthase catalytic subunit
VFLLSETPLDPGALVRQLVDPGAGALVTFEGWVRNHNEGREVIELEYEAYPELATSEGMRVLAEASERFDLVAARCIHRVGRLSVGDVAVWIGVSAAHRDAAFRACRYIIDEVKSRVPIWKREHCADGTTSWLGSTG